jgi:plastocyanin
VDPGRVLIVVLALVVGAAAIYFSIQTLQDMPGIAGESVGADGGPGTSDLRTVGVDMKGIEFVPERVSVRAGQRVRWTNLDSTAHTATKVSGPGPDFDSGEIGGNGSYEYTPLQRGVIKYMCELHPQQMRAKISVLGE